MYGPVPYDGNTYTGHEGGEYVWCKRDDPGKIIVGIHQITVVPMGLMKMVVSVCLISCLTGLLVSVF